MRYRPGKTTLFVFLDGGVTNYRYCASLSIEFEGTIGPLELSDWPKQRFLPWCECRTELRDKRWVAVVLGVGWWIVREGWNRESYASLVLVDWCDRGASKFLIGGNCQREQKLSALLSCGERCSRSSSLIHLA